jgi:hypothetical protein
MNTNVLDGVKCPKCGSFGPFRLYVIVHGIATVCDDGWDDLQSTQSQFPGDAPAYCFECSHSGKFDDFVEEIGDDGMSEQEREMGMAHGNRGLADYGGLDLDYEGCIGHGCQGCPECDPEESEEVDDD